MLRDAWARRLLFLVQADQHWGMLKTYCVACHNAKLRTGGLAFDELDPAAALDPNPAKWRCIASIEKSTRTRSTIFSV